MSNGFHKWLRHEDVLHNTCCTWLAYQYPKLLFTHPANEGKRTPFEQFKAKFLFMTSGVPDILIFNMPCTAIEFKYGKNKSTENQAAFQKRLKEIGWNVYEVNNFEEFKSIINKIYGKY